VGSGSLITRIQITRLIYRYIQYCYFYIAQYVGTLRPLSWRFESPSDRRLFLLNFAQPLIAHPSLPYSLPYTIGTAAGQEVLRGGRRSRRVTENFSPPTLRVG
jgi:hypothetical protein